MAGLVMAGRRQAMLQAALELAVAAAATLALAALPTAAVALIAPAGPFRDPTVKVVATSVPPGACS